MNQTGLSGKKGMPMRKRAGIANVMQNASLKDHSPWILEAPKPVIEEAKNPKTMIMLVREDAVLRRCDGAFSVT
jgi:hypothetical protein